MKSHSLFMEELLCFGENFIGVCQLYIMSLHITAIYISNLGERK